MALEEQGNLKAFVADFEVGAWRKAVPLVAASRVCGVVRRPVWTHIVKCSQWQTRGQPLTALLR